MPCATVHRAIAKIVNTNYLNYQKEDSLLLEIGSIAADSWRHTKNITRQKSHFVDCGEENVELFLKKYSKDLRSPFFCGYYIHLLTDYYFRYHHLGASSNNVESYKKLIDELDIYSIPLLSKEELSLVPNIPEVDKEALQASIEYLFNHPYSTRSIPNDYNVLLAELNACAEFVINKLDLVLHDAFV